MILPSFTRHAVLLTVLCMTAGQCLSQSGIPAFPGADGFGKSSIGGRGGRVIYVTNLNNSGPGSLREACESSGPRIVVFSTGGTIQLSDPIIITNPYLTIAGQTAPGGGVCIKGDMMTIEAHDVIIRNIRIRVGAASQFTHGIQVALGSDRVVIDHCSFSWSEDALVATWDTVANVTVQDCIISEVLSGHSVALGPGPGENEGGSKYLTNFSFIRNLVAHGEGRNPKVHYHAEVANNVVYNWENIACYASIFAELDFIGNHYIKGPSSGVANTITLQLPEPSLKVFVSDNRTPELPNGGPNQWSIVNGSTQYQSATRLHSSGFQPAASSQVFDLVMDNAGAFPRDPVDLRIEADVRNGTGSTISTEAEVGGFPFYAIGTPRADADADGMPNSWETDNGLNPNNPGDANGDRNGDGYLNIEEYINSLIEPQATTARAGPDQELCGTSATTLAGNTPLVGEGIWNVISGGASVLSPNSPSSVVTNLQIGTNVLSWRITHEGLSTRDTVIITIYQVPTQANAGVDQELCNTSQGTLHATPPTVGNGVWRTITGPAVVTDPSNPNTPVNALRVGLNEFEWLVTGHYTCPQDRDTVSLIVYDLPKTADAGLNKTLCNTASTSLAGNPPAEGSGLWRVISGTATIVDPSSFNSAVNNLQVGANVLEWSISNGTCPVSRDSVTITRVLSAAAGFTWEINVLSVQFTSTSANGATYQWSFGDGTTSTERSPTHLYSVLRSFRVTHTASNACGTARSTNRVNLLGGQARMDITPASLDFGSIQVGQTTSGAITVLNSGTDSLDIEDVVAEGSIAPGVFLDNKSLVIAPGDSAEVVVHFSPGSGGLLNGQLIVAGYDTSVIIPLAAQVTDPTLLKADLPFPDSFSFGPAEPGTTVRGTIILSNGLAETLRIDSIRISGDSPGPFSFEGVSAPRRIAADANDEVGNPVRSTPLYLLRQHDTLGVSVAYSPTGEENDSSSLLVFTGSGLWTVALAGQGGNAGGIARSESAVGETHPSVDAPREFQLRQNYPNPFNPTTTIGYALPVGGTVTLRIFNVLGQEVATLVHGEQDPGYYSVAWNAGDMAGGVYFYQLRAGENIMTKRLLLVK